MQHHMSHCCSHFGNIRSIAEYSATAVKVKSFTFLAFLLLLVPTMHVTSYVTNNFHPCLRHSTPFDLLLGQASSCTWFEFWAHPETAYQRFACFFSIAIGVLIFNYLMLRTLYDHTFAFSLPCRVSDFTLLFMRIFLRFPAVFLLFSCPNVFSDSTLCCAQSCVTLWM